MLCVCPAGGVFPVGSGSLLKLSQAGKCWERYWGFFSAENNGGVGGRWHFLTIHIENVIISVTMITKMLLVTRRAKMPLQAVFAFRDIKSCGTPENAVQRIYIKTGNTKTAKMYAVQGQQKTAYIYIYI